VIRRPATNWRTWLPLAIGVIGLLAYPVITAVAGHNASTTQINQTRQEIIAYEHFTWCQAMDLLTAEPVPKPSDPSANPSRVRDYQYYQTFLTIHRKLHC
jgi:hypothetical protein